MSTHAKKRTHQKRKILLQRIERRKPCMDERPSNLFKNARVIDKENYRVRKTLESWHTAMTTEADNNALV